MKELFFWLICFTSIDNSSQITNHELKNCFLEAYPQYKKDIKLGGLIGMFLYYLYPNELVKINEGGKSICYNLRVHSKPVKEIIINDLE